MKCFICFVSLIREIELHTACKNGDLDRVRELLEAGVFVDNNLVCHVHVPLSMSLCEWVQRVTVSVISTVLTNVTLHDHTKIWAIH